jgi:mRNA-degrading endonuclease RelE of RelBE toxin-antitoxin system
MSYAVVFLSRARKELLDAWDWYEERQFGLGDRFFNEISRKIEKIQKLPQSYPSKQKGFYESRIDVFPYLIIYRIQKQKKIVVITSIFHTKRNPKTKYRE